jgi:hypothetical protein
MDLLGVQNSGFWVNGNGLRVKDEGFGFRVVSFKLADVGFTVKGWMYRVTGYNRLRTKFCESGLRVRVEGFKI